MMNATFHVGGAHNLPVVVSDSGKAGDVYLMVGDVAIGVLEAGQPPKLKLDSTYLVPTKLDDPYTFYLRDR